MLRYNSNYIGNAMPNNIKLIAEIGINHNGSYETAKNLILALKPQISEL